MSGSRDPRSHGTRQAPGGSGQALFVLGLTIGLLVAVLVDRGTRFFLDQDLELVRAVRDLASDEFVEEVDSHELIDDALRGMLSGLDRYSHYYGPEELAALDRETSGQFLGIGVVFRAGEPGRILFPYPGSPADEVGLRVGDRIVTASGQTVADMSAGDLQRVLHEGEAPLELDVEDAQGTLRQVRLTPDVVLDPTVRHDRMLDPAQGLGYLSVRSFSHRTPEEFDAAVLRLKKQGLRALVLDLRANPGGILDSAVDLANRFVPSGVLVYTRTRTELRATEARPEEATLAGLPLVILIDDASASASEVLAASLQDHAAALLVGVPSYGKGKVQTLKRIGRRRAVVKFTTALYFSPSMRSIEHYEDDGEHSGIAPDLLVPLSAEEQRAIHRFLFSYSPPEDALPAIREWEQRDGVSLLNEPPPDRQLDAAVSLLTGQAVERLVVPLH